MGLHQSDGPQRIITELSREVHVVFAEAASNSPYGSCFGGRLRLLFSRSREDSRENPRGHMGQAQTYRYIKKEGKKTGARTVLCSTPRAPGDSRTCVSCLRMSPLAMQPSDGQDTSISTSDGQGPISSPQPRARHVGARGRQTREAAWKEPTGQQLDLRNDFLPVRAESESPA